MMRITFISLIFLLISQLCIAQNDFIGIAKYKISVLGSTDKNTDSMSVVFDKERVLIILYIPDGNKTNENYFIDDFQQGKSFRIDRDKHSFVVDSLRTSTGYNFKNTNSIGYAANNELCLRYKAELSAADKTTTTNSECLVSINLRNSRVKDYSFLGVQPIIVDNRIVMDFTVTKLNGTKPNIALSSFQKLDNVDAYFDMKGYSEEKK